MIYSRTKTYLKRTIDKDVELTFWFQDGRIVFKDDKEVRRELRELYKKHIGRQGTLSIKVGE